MSKPHRYPATFAQRGMFLHNAAHPSDTSFDLAFVFRLGASTDLDLLIDATQAVFTACPGISTTFEENPSGIEAIVRPSAASVEVSSLDPTLAGAPVSDRDAAIARKTQEQIEAGPIMPEDPKQVTARFYRGPDVHHMSLVASHLVGDAYSFYRVVGSISELYARPRSEWADVLGELSEHPGTIAPVPTTAAAVSRYRELLTGVESFTHTGLKVSRIEGKIIGERHRRVISGPAAERIRSSGEFATFGAATVFFAAYAATLQRLSGEEQVVLGVPLAGRAGYRAKGAMGFFVNTLPLPVRITSAETWRGLCEQVKSGIRVLQSNQGLDLAGPDGTELTSGTYAGIDNAVTFYKQGLVLSLGSTEATSVPLQRAALSYPFSATVSDDGSEFVVEVGVADHLIDTHPERLFDEALDAIVSRPTAAVVDGSVFVENVADDARATGPTVIDAIEAIAANKPNAISLRMGTEALTYSQLVALYTSAAGVLDAIEATRLVVVSMAPSIDAVVAMLAVMASGRTYVPVDPAAPSARTSLILSRVEEENGSRPTTLVDGRLLSQSADSNVVNGNALVRSRRPARLLRRPTMEDRAYIIFTSGSTGEPKGVVIPHHNLTALLSAAETRVGYLEGDTWCLFHSLAFDFSIWEVFGPLTSGCTLVIPRADQVGNPEAFARFVEREGITVLNQTPSAFRRLTDALVRAGGRLPSVRIIVFGGEALYPADLREWFARISPQTRFLNMYGITETTVHVTLKEINQDAVDFEHRSLIGEPLPHLGALVVDSFGRPCPPGVAGELLVTGAALAEGYLGQPDLTAKRFRSVRLTDGVRRAYVTGDRVRRDRDGELVYVGRLDDQVQLRGYRIELGEISSALVATGHVRATVVRVIKKEGSQPFLAAWIVPATNDALDTDTIAAARRALADRLPPYMVPAVIVPVDAIPTTKNGKPDMAQLPLVSAADEAEGGAAPSDLASRIALVWEETIGAGRVRAHDRFMEVGGTSMHVMEVHDRLHTDLGLVDVTLIDLFEHATPAELAAFVLTRSGNS
ncbi:hypothetical protein BMF89_19515 [Arthrobacter sp. SRS-W-1-2016]|nr:hypothetical protein BMF89_19515 [Arthrobacter sp. SRS-W-1-2016]